MTIRSAAIVIPLVILAGCDLGTYEKRRATAMTSINKQAAGLQIPAKGGGGTGVILTLPQVLGKATDIKAVAGPITVDGIVGMYEAANSNGSGPLLLVGGVPAAEGPMDKVVANVDAALKAAAPGQQVAVSDLKPTIKRLFVNGEQAFASGKAPGRTDAYVVSSASHISILIFRTTDANDSTKAFEQQVNAAIAGLTGDAPLAAGS